MTWAIGGCYYLEDEKLGATVVFVSAPHCMVSGVCLHAGDRERVLAWVWHCDGILGLGFEHKYA